MQRIWKKKIYKTQQQFSKSDDFLLLLSVMTVSGPLDLQMKAPCTTGGTGQPSVSLL